MTKQRFSIQWLISHKKNRKQFAPIGWINSLVWTENWSENIFIPRSVDESSIFLNKIKKIKKEVALSEIRIYCFKVFLNTHGYVIVTEDQSGNNGR